MGLEATFGSKWRQGDKLRARFRTRKTVIEWMQSQADAKGVTVEEIARRADDSLGSPDKVCRLLKRGETVNVD